MYKWVSIVDDTVVFIYLDFFWRNQMLFVRWSTIILNLNVKLNDDECEERVKMSREWTIKSVRKECKRVKMRRECEERGNYYCEWKSKVPTNKLLLLLLLCVKIIKKRESDSVWERIDRFVRNERYFVISSFIELRRFT